MWFRSARSRPPAFLRITEPMASRPMEREAVALRFGAELSLKEIAAALEQR